MKKKIILLTIGTIFSFAESFPQNITIYDMFNKNKEVKQQPFNNKEIIQKEAIKNEIKIDTQIIISAEEKSETTKNS